jgi:hypothetical protein
MPTQTRPPYGAARSTLCVLREEQPYDTTSCSPIWACIPQTRCLHRQTVRMAGCWRSWRPGSARVQISQDPSSTWGSGGKRTWRSASQGRKNSSWFVKPRMDVHAALKQCVHWSAAGGVATQTHADVPVLADLEATDILVFACQAQGACKATTTNPCCTPYRAVHRDQWDYR